MMVTLASASADSAWHEPAACSLGVGGQRHDEQRTRACGQNHDGSLGASTP